MDSLIKDIKDYLIREGFKSGDEIIYIKTSEVTDNSQIMIINGQRIVKPGNKHIIKYLIEFMGKGLVSEVDKDDEEFLLIDFKIFNNNNIIGSTNMSFYKEDFNLFINYYNRLIQI